MAFTILGGGILLLVFAGLFAFTTWGMGWRMSLAIWTASIAVTAVVVVGAYLLTTGMAQL